MDPPRTAKFSPRNNYPWVASLIQDSKDTGYAIFMSRKLVFGFVLVFSSSWLLFNLEFTYSSSNYSQEKSSTKIAKWLQSFSKVVHPQFPDENDRLMVDIVMGERPCDWLHSYVSLIPQLTSSFACTTWNSLRDSSLLILAYLPLLKQTMSSRQIILAYIAGGFLASNIEGAVMYFTNPYARLSAAQLQELLDHIPPSLYSPASRERQYDFLMYELRELESEATVIMGAALEEEMEELEAQITEKKKEIEGLRELDSTFTYTRRALGTSCAITCLATIASLALPKSPWRFLVRVNTLHSLSFDVLWLLSPRPNNINHLGHIAGNVAGVSLWLCRLRWSKVGKLPVPRLGTYTGGIVLLPWAIQYFLL